MQPLFLCMVSVEVRDTCCHVQHVSLLCPVVCRLLADKRADEAPCVLVGLRGR